MLDELAKDGVLSRGDRVELERLVDVEQQVQRATEVAAYRRYLATFVAGKATVRGDDFTSALLAIHDENPDSLTHEEISSIVYGLTFAGHETTNYLIGNLVYRLLRSLSAGTQ